MTIIASRRYVDGRAVGDVDLSDALPERASDVSDFCWIGLHDATRAEMEPLQHRFGLHPLAVEDALDPRHPPKLEQYGEDIFLIARTIRLEKGRIVHANTAMFVSRHVILTVRHGPSRDHGRVREKLEATPLVLAKGPDHVLHALLDHIVAGYMPVIDVMEDQALALEDRALNESLTREDTGRLFLLRRDLFRLLRTESAMEELISRLRNLKLIPIDKDILPYFRDLSDQVRRVSARTSDLRETLSGAIETTTMLAQQRQGEVTKRLAAWAAILAVPTAVAGIYGMNFEHMPELRMQFGYPAVLGVIGTICLGLYLRFKRSGWL